MITDFEQYFTDGSPFQLQVEYATLNSILRDLALEQDYWPGEAIAKILGMYGTNPAIQVLGHMSGRFAATPEDLREYIHGFSRPLSLLLTAYGGLTKTDNNGVVANTAMAWKLLKWMPESEEQVFLAQYINQAVALLQHDPLGIDLVNQIVDYELLNSLHLYYSIGLEAVRRAFLQYVDIITTIVVPFHETSLLSLTSVLTKCAQLPPPPSRPISEKTQELERSFAQFIDKPSIKTVALLSLKHPMLILRALSKLPRFYYKAFKNPNEAVRQVRKIDHVLPTMQEKVRGEWRPGELTSRLDSEVNVFQESWQNVVPPQPYPSKKFTQDIQHIRQLADQVSVNPEVADKLFDAWKSLAMQPALEEYSALWTSICIAFGSMAEQHYTYVQHHEHVEGYCKKRLIKAARQAYSLPLKKASLWKADLGTRYLCATRLGSLYCSFGEILGMSAMELAQAIHDVDFEALQVNERLYQRSPFKESKEKLQARAEHIVTRIIEASVFLSRHCAENEDKVKWFRQAFMLSEQGKSRMLREELALSDRSAPPNVPLSLWKDEERYLHQLKKLYSDLTIGERTPTFGPSELEKLNQERNEVRLELEQIWTRMEAVQEAVPYVSSRRDEALQWGELEWDSFQKVANSLGERVALVSLHSLPHAVHISVLRGGANAPTSTIIPLTSSALNVYIANYTSEIFDNARGKFSDWPEREAPLSTWLGLGEELLRPITPLLAGCEYVYFLPHGQFHRLPLHALTVNGMPFIEQWAVAYAPSVSVLEATISRRLYNGTTLVMGYGDDGSRVTDWILQEADAIAQRFNTSPMRQHEATATLLKELAPSASLIHLSCHGMFNPNEPLASSIQLADGNFTAYQWLQLGLQADLVTLSACQTGMSDIRPGDDLVGLMRAILFAGASSLLMTLWSVNARSTLQWMLTFYENIWDDQGLQKLDKAKAFQLATLALKRKYPDPYFWAPFKLIGNYL